MDAPTANHPDLPVLAPTEQRILGALLEKQVTVPASYPMSLSALHTACNQATSRDPVTDYSTSDIETTCRTLKDRGLVRIVWAGAGSRVLKYHQRLEEVLELSADEKAILTLLLLRGEQPAGELKTRAERLHGFDDRDAVTAVLRRMADAVVPLVAELPRRAGQHDTRWVHLLGPVAVTPRDPAAAGRVDRDVVLARGAADRDARVVAAYDACAAAYAAAMRDELAHKPFDLWLLGRVAAEASGPIADVGCGPGQVTAFLAESHPDVTGVDISPGMIQQARTQHPHVTFAEGDLSRLLRPPHAAAWGAITAWYALVHLSDSELPQAIDALGRVVAPGGVLALAVHVGQEVRHADEWFGAAVDLDVVLHDRQDVLDVVVGAGFTTIEWYVRSPVPEEVATERLYVVARRPVEAGLA